MNLYYAILLMNYKHKLTLQKLPGILLSLLLIGCDSQQVEDHHHPELTTGQDYFDFHCSGCHGYQGKGNFLEGIPGNIFSTLSSREIEDLIITGRQHENRNMPVFVNMPRKEARLIVMHLKTLRDEFENTQNGKIYVPLQ